MTNATMQPIATMTRAILIPNEDVPIEILAKYHADKILHPAIKLKKRPLPLFMGKVSAGFPSPADDYIEKTLDLNELLVQKPAGIFPNDILVVDRSIEPVSGKVVICAVDGELTVKRLIMEAGQWKLRAENTDYPDIMIYEEIDMVIWGVVTNVIHSL